MIRANSISEVINYLDHIIDWSRQKESRIGYFATLYRKMTIAVKKGIDESKFEDGKRMELLDVIFANRYLQAWEAYVNKQKCSNAWCTAFDAASTKNLIVLQHLVLGINTHINLDLGVAAAEACPGDEIHALEGDFNKINDVIATLFDDVQNDLAQIWPPLAILARLANHRQEAVLNFSISAARKASWNNALCLAGASKQAKEAHVKLMDDTVVILANRVINPGIAVKFILKPVLQMESKNVKDIIEVLYD